MEESTEKTINSATPWKGNRSTLNEYKESEYKFGLFNESDPIEKYCIQFFFKP